MYCSTICIELSRAWVEQSSTLKWSNVFKCWAGWLGPHNGILTSAINRVSVSAGPHYGGGGTYCVTTSLSGPRKLNWSGMCQRVRECEYPGYQWSGELDNILLLHVVNHDATPEGSLQGWRITNIYAFPGMFSFLGIQISWKFNILEKMTDLKCDICLFLYILMSKDLICTLV